MTDLSPGDSPQGAARVSSASTGSTMAIAITLTTVGVLPVFLAGSLAVQIRQDLGLSRTGLGLAVSAFFATAALTSVFAGRIVRRLGSAATMQAAALYQGVMALVIALVASSPVLLIVLLGIAGFGNGAMQPAINLFLSDRVSPTRQGLAFGIKQAAIPVATLVGGLAVPVVALTIGWRYGFGGAAALAVVGWWIVPRDIGFDATRRDAVALRFHRRRPAVQPEVLAPDPGSLPEEALAYTTAGVPGAVLDGPSAGAVGATRALPEPPAMARRALVVLAVGIALGSGAANGLGAFLVTSAVDIGFRPGVAGLLAALGSAVGLTTRIGTGAMADRRTFRQFRVVVVMLAVGAVGYLGLASGERWLFIPAALIAYGSGWGWNGLFNYTVVRTHPGAVAQATGLTQAGVYVGGIVGPLGVGLLLGVVSFSVVWLVAAATALVAAATIAVGRRMMVRWIGDRSDRSDLSVFL